MDSLLPYTEVSGGLLPPTRPDRIFRARLWFQNADEAPAWDVIRVIDVPAHYTPRELVRQQVRLINDRFGLEVNPQDYVLQADEAPGVVLESIECPQQKLIDYPWINSQLVCERDIEIRLVRAEGSVAWKDTKRRISERSPSPFSSALDSPTFSRLSGGGAGASVNLEGVENILEDAFASMRTSMMQLDERTSQKLRVMSHRLAGIAQSAEYVALQRKAPEAHEPSPGSLLSFKKLELECRKKEQAFEKITETQRLREKALLTRLEEKKSATQWEDTVEKHVSSRLAELDCHFAEYIEHTGQRLALFEDALRDQGMQDERFVKQFPHAATEHSHSPLSTPRTLLSQSPLSQRKRERERDDHLVELHSHSRQSFVPVTPGSPGRYRGSSQSPRSPQGLRQRNVRRSKRPPGPKKEAPQMRHANMTVAALHEHRQRESHRSRDESGAGEDEVQLINRGSFDQVAKTLQELEDEVLLEKSSLETLTRQVYLERREGLPSKRSVQMYDAYNKLMSPVMYVF